MLDTGGMSREGKIAGLEGAKGCIGCLVSGAVVVAPAFMQLLKDTEGQVSEADWSTAVEWLVFVQVSIQLRVCGGGGVKCIGVLVSWARGT